MSINDAIIQCLNQNDYQQKAVNNKYSEDLYQIQTNKQLNNTRELLRQISYLHLMHHLKIIQKQ